MKQKKADFEGSSMSVSINKEAGYTLTELLVVLVIIALLTGLVAPRLIGRIGGAKSTTAQTQIENLVSALEIYRLDIGEFPTQQDGLNALITAPKNASNWHGPYLRKNKVPKDPWGNDYMYTLSDSGQQVIVRSFGKDGRVGGEGENADLSSDS